MINISFGLGGLSEHIKKVTRFTMSAKETNGMRIPPWESWINMTAEQREYELHRNLSMMNSQMEELRKITGSNSFVGGLIGGALTIGGLIAVKFISGL